MSAEKRFAPWSESEVMALWLWQGDPLLHPFTCPTDSCKSESLTPTSSGWICGECNYSQDWCFAFMLKTAETLAFLEKHKNIKDISDTITFQDDDSDS